MKKAIIIWILLHLTALAGVTGKLAGKVTDAVTGEPLLGANIVLQGTSFGAASDINGNYTVLNIPPGNYTVKVTYLG